MYSYLSEQGFNVHEKQLLIGQKNVRLSNLFLDLQKISSLLPDEKCCLKFVFVTHYVYKCISTKHLGKNLIWQNISPDKIIRWR